MEPITPDETAEMQRILGQWYGPGVATWAITPSHYELLGKVMDASMRCSRAMDFVPRPLTMADPFNWLKKQARDMARRYLLSDEGKHYMICITVAARNFRTPMEEAGRGL